MAATDLEVHIARDTGSGLWYVASSDVPGLRLEAPSASALIGKIEDAAPELIELNRAEIERRTAQPVAGATFRPVFDTPLSAAA